MREAVRFSAHTCSQLRKSIYRGGSSGFYRSIMIRMASEFMACVERKSAREISEEAKVPEMPLRQMMIQIDRLASYLIVKPPT